MHRTCHTSVYMSCSYMQCAWRDSVDPGTELSITPCSAILKHICVKRKLPCFTANFCGKQCQAAKWKKWQRWSWVVFFVFYWNVDYMSNISKSICLGITTLYKSDLLASIFQTAAQTCFYSLYLCSCALEREMERRCKRCVRIYVILCVYVCVSLTDCCFWL